jgi:predicted MFS family arabinose efflux permease
MHSNGRNDLLTAGEAAETGSLHKAPGLLIALLVAVASFQLNATMLAPAIQSMANSLHTSTANVGLGSTLFLFSAALAGIVLPPLSDRIGRRTVLVWSIAVMALGSLVSTVASSVVMLDIGRLLQGTCGATIAIGIVTLRRTMTVPVFGRYLGILTAINSGVAGVDTLLGGVITDTVGFRGLFAFMFLLEVIAVVLLRRFVPQSVAPSSGPLDWIGMLLLSLTMFAITLALTLGFGQTGWSAPITIGSAVGAVVLAVCFFVRERTAAAPLLPISFMRSRSVWSLLLTTFATMASSFAVLLFLIPAYSQDTSAGLGLDATKSALLFLMPFSLLGWVLAPVVGQLAPKLGYRAVLWFGLIGNIVLLVASALLLHNMWLLAACVFLMGATYSAAALTTLNGLGVLFAPAAYPGILPGLNASMFNFGASVGIGVMASSLGSGGYRGALFIAVAFACVALLASLLIPSRASSTEKI